MKARLKKLLPPIIALLLASMLLALFLANYELKMVKQRTSPSAMAESDRFLALARLLDSAGARVGRIGAGDVWLEGDENLVIVDQYLLDDQLALENDKDLENWIRQGGRLVVLVMDPESLGESAGPWIGSQGIRVKASVEDSGTLSGKPEPGILDAGSRRLAMHWDTRVELFPAADLVPTSLGKQGKDLRWVAIPLGEGSLTVTGDGHFWDNDNLGNLDHASSIGVLFEGGPGSPVTRILETRREFPEAVWPASWLSLIWPALTGLCLLVWHSSLRFGPAIRMRRTDRRSIAERFAADARFQWERGGKELLQASVRNSFLRHASRKFHEKDIEILSGRLETLTGVARAEWTRFLGGQKTWNAQEFRHFMNLTEKTRRRL